MSPPRSRALLPVAGSWRQMQPPQTSFPADPGCSPASGEQRVGTGAAAAQAAAVRLRATDARCCPRGALLEQTLGQPSLRLAPFLALALVVLSLPRVPAAAAPASVVSCCFCFLALLARCLSLLPWNISRGCALRKGLHRE